MGTLLLIQIALDLAFIAIIAVFLIERQKSKTYEDPRLSRGLQMLSSKIAIIEDLMDRSEKSGKQMSQLLEAKQQDIQELVESVEVHLHKVQESMEKSKSIAKLFQDKIPHEEIIERQNAAKYLRAAKLANTGKTAEEILKEVDIPRGELDLIVKLNRQSLITNQDDAWVESIAEVQQQEAEAIKPVVFQDFSAPAPTAEPVAEPIQASAPTPAAPVVEPKRTLVYSAARLNNKTQDASTIRPVIFKKITLDSGSKLP